MLQDCKINFEMEIKGAGKEKTFVNQSLIFSLLIANIVKKIKC